MSEEFGFEKAGGDGSAIHFDEIASPARAEFVDGAGDNFLAGAGLAADENSGAGRRDGFDLREDVAEAAAAANYGVKKGRLRAVEFTKRRFISTIEGGGHSLTLPISAKLCKGS
jgi:hypothetical protein